APPARCRGRRRSGSGSRSRRSRSSRSPDGSSGRESGHFRGLARAVSAPADAALAPQLLGMSHDLELALSLADDADAITLPRFRAHDLRVETKPDLTPV